MLNPKPLPKSGFLHYKPPELGGTARPFLEEL